MDWLPLLFNMRGTHQVRAAFEEGVLAHQAIRRWLSVADLNLFLRVSSYYVVALSPVQDALGPWNRRDEDEVIRQALVRAVAK